MEIRKEPFLKWPGGKRWLAPLITELAREKLASVYFEPFLGSGAVFFALAPKVAVLADANRLLIECMETVRDYPQEVVSSMWRFSNAKDCYYRVRDSEPRTQIGAAARFLYLNRTCWGGLFRLNKEGKFNVPFGNSQRIMCRKGSVTAAAAALSDCELLTSDFEVVLQRAGKGDVVYADPPYTTKGQNNGFIRYNEKLFAWTDQERLARACHKASSNGASVIVSGFWHRSVLGLYPGWWAIRVTRQSCVSRERVGRKRVSEALILNWKPKQVDCACWQEVRHIDNS